MARVRVETVTMTGDVSVRHKVILSAQTVMLTFPICQEFVLPPQTDDGDMHSAIGAILRLLEEGMEPQAGHQAANPASGVLLQTNRD